MPIMGPKPLKWAAVLRTGVAGCPIKNRSPVLTETSPVEHSLDQSRPYWGDGGVHLVLGAKTELSPSPKDAKIEETQAALI